MSLKVCTLDAHLDKFKENMGTNSEEQGEGLHQDILDAAAKEHIMKT